MTERAAFVSAILDNPDDDTPRLVFADWLQEHGEEPRAEFIRLQVEDARRPEGEQSTGQPFTRATTLEVAHRSAWRGAIGLKHYDGRYKRGFLTGVGTDWSRYPVTAARVFAIEPADFTLELRAFDEGELLATPDGIESFASLPNLRAITEITSHTGGFGAELFVRLMRSPHLQNLKSIAIFNDVIGLEGVRAVAESPSPFAIEDLDLNSALQHDDIISECDETFAAIRLIATSPRFASLKRLGLMFNGLDDRSIETLLASTTLPRTLRVALADNEFDEERFAKALAERFAGGSDGGED